MVPVKAPRETSFFDDRPAAEECKISSALLSRANRTDLPIQVYLQKNDSLSDRSHLDQYWHILILRYMTDISIYCNSIDSQSASPE